jgi:hypothetical protein
MGSGVELIWMRGMSTCWRIVIRRIWEMGIVDGVKSLDPLEIYPITSFHSL